MNTCSVETVVEQLAQGRHTAIEIATALGMRTHVSSVIRVLAHAVRQGKAVSLPALGSVPRMWFVAVSPLT